MRRRSLLLLAPAWAAAQATPTLELNEANQAELEMLPGIGPAQSEALLAERRRGGPYRSWRELVARVKGLGPVRARKLSEAGLRVDGLAWPD